MAWSDRKYRRGRREAEHFLSKRRHNLTDLVEQHYQLDEVDEYEVGWRDFTLEALEGADKVWAAKFLLRCNLPASSYGRLVFLGSSDQVVWLPHPFHDEVVEAFYAEDGEHPIITVDLGARDYTVGDGVLDT